MVLKTDPGGLGPRHPFRNMNERSVRTLDNQDHPVRTPVVPTKPDRNTSQRMKTVMNSHLFRGKTGSMGLP